ncbi:MAG: amino acid adenylation domain-containing protein, partial [Planctomycetota bacterium]
MIGLVSPHDSNNDAPGMHSKSVLDRKPMNHDMVPDSAFPLHPNQLLVWTGQQRAPDVPLYDMPVRFDFEGQIDHQRFIAAFDLLQQHTPLLRVVADDANWTRPLVSPTPTTTTAFVDLSCDHADGGNTNVDQHIRQRIAQTLSSTQRLVDSVLYRLNATKYVWLLRLHHIMTDGLNGRVLIDQMNAWYRYLGNESPRPDHPVLSDPRQHASDLSDNAKQWWEERAEIEPSTIAPANFRRDSESGCFASSRWILPLDAAVTDAQQQAIQRAPFRALTPGMGRWLLHATTLAVCLHRAVDPSPDPKTIALGSTIHGRETTRDKNTLGMFTQILPAACTITPETAIADLASSLSSESFGLMRHGGRAAMRPQNQTSHRVVLNLMDFEAGDFDGMPVRQTWLHSGFADPNRDLAVSIVCCGEQDFQLILDGRSDRFSRHDLSAFADRYLAVLQQITAADPTTPLDRLKLLSDADVRRLNHDLSAAPSPTRSETPNSLWQRFETIRRQHPDSVAVVDDQIQLTYADLSARARAIAQRIDQQTSHPLVPVLCRRDASAIVAMLAVAASERCFVPIDADQPEMRIQAILKDVGGPGHLDATGATGSGSRVDWITRPTANNSAAQNDTDANSTNDSTDLHAATMACYLLYTSGSTGVPNGVLVEFASLWNLLTQFENDAPLPTGVRAAWWTSVGFDVAMYEVFSTLLFGRTLWIPGDALRSDAAGLLNALSQHRIASAYLPPAILPELADAVNADASRFSSLKRLLVGVEPIPQNVLANIAGPLHELNLINGYGPTECTVCATLHRVNPENNSTLPTPIGRPVQGTSFRIVDRQDRAVPPGSAGQLLISGDCLSLGYWQRPALNTDRFFSCPETDQRWYRTGDRVAIDTKGQIHFFGRIDEQLKWNGVRIDPQEIVSAIQSLRDVPCFVCLDRQASAGTPANAKPMLIAIVESPDEVDLDQMHQQIRERLPRGIVPQRIFRVDVFPRTTNDKVDRKALLQQLATERRDQEARPGQTSPSNRIEDATATS